MIWLVAIAPAVVALVLFAGTIRVRPRRSLLHPLRDDTARFRRLRLVHGGGGRQ